ncbi:uncharacterized protein LOC129922842 isoform X3 [Biomphalaria glabrata]|uniref:Uncharacterized protein LOC129922842 isoform X3 n=1 Tax=Biomphalaria glabrata TaxID=6526 RepID=A0A9W2YUW9_BIOGL|nr:uncharacterized protein LOC129922842 isoform X3 [Biomphalaria glabrata]
MRKYSEFPFRMDSGNSLKSVIPAITQYKDQLYSKKVTIHLPTMYTLVLPLIINLCVLANIVTTKNAPFNITCESTSKCGNVVIENEDTFNCLTEIDEGIKKYNITQYSVRFYVAKENIDIEGKNLQHTCQVFLLQGCQEQNQPCNCSGNYDIDWNFTARYDKHNKARIQARLFQSSSSVIYSNILTGPRIIKDPRNSTFQLLVNNKEVHDNEKIKCSKYDELLFSIFPQDSAEVLSLHDVINNQTFKSGQKVRVKSHYIIINIKLCDRELRSYNLILQYDDLKQTASIIPESSTKTTSKDDKNGNSTIIWAPMIAIGVLLFAIIVFTYMFCSREKYNACKERFVLTL